MNNDVSLSLLCRVDSRLCTFIERIRADGALRDIPAILVTSLASPEAVKRGEEIGAQGYMIKSEFDQAQLLALIRQLVA